MVAAKRAGGLSPKKIAAVHVAKRQLALDDENYRAILSATAGVTSATELNELTFIAVMRRFAELGFRSNWSKRTYGERPGMAAPAQVHLIRRLWSEWSVDGEAGLDKWLARFHGVSALRFVDAARAGRVITSLRAMVARRSDAAPSRPQ